MNGTADQTLALATVTSPSFLPGTLVLLHSFLRQNDWFDGDIVIIQQDLTEQDKARIHSRFERVKFIRPRPSLCKNIDALVRAVPSLGAQHAQFLSIEAIGLTAYDRVLFCDSDLLFQGSVQELFALPHALVCCGDGAYFRGNARHPESFSEMAQDPANIGLRRTFNAGFMLLDKSTRTPENLTALIDMIDPEKWRENPTGHTDQFVFNVFFDGSQHIVGAEYNYVLLHRGMIQEQSGLSMSDAKVLHFNGAAKPWDPARMRALMERDADILKAVNLWNDAHREMWRTP